MFDFDWSLNTGKIGEYITECYLEKCGNIDYVDDVRDNVFYRFSDVDYIAHIEKWNDYETGRYFRASVSALILTNEKLYADNQRLTAKLKHFKEDKEI